MAPRSAAIWPPISSIFWAAETKLFAVEMKSLSCICTPFWMNRPYSSRGVSWYSGWSDPRLYVAGCCVTGGLSGGGGVVPPLPVLPGLGSPPGTMASWHAVRASITMTWRNIRNLLRGRA